MDKATQAAFVRELIDNVKAEILGKVESFPDNWDGHELRQFIADRFAEVSFTLKQKDNRRRYRAYKNDITTRLL